MSPADLVRREVKWVMAVAAVLLTGSQRRHISFCPGEGGSDLKVHQGSYSLEFLKKSWNLPSNFSDQEKVWKMEIKSGKIVRSLNFFLVVKSHSISPIAKIFNHRMRISFIILYVRIATWLQYICSASWKKFDSCVSLLTTYLLTLSLEK